MPFAVAVVDAECGGLAHSTEPGRACGIFGAAADVNVMPELANWLLFHNGRAMSTEQFPVLRACRDGVEIVAEELEFLAPGGKRAVLLANARAIRDREGKIMGAVAAFVDITPQKELAKAKSISPPKREAEEASSAQDAAFWPLSATIFARPPTRSSLLAELMRRTAVNPAMAQDIPELAPPSFMPCRRFC